MNNPKGHHYISKLLLRGFANTTEKLWAYERGTGKCWPTNITKAGKKENLYRIFHDAVSDQLALEKMFSEIETQAASGIKKLRSRDYVSDKDRSDMSAYFGTLYYRTLPSYEWAKKGMEDRILEALSDPYDPLKDPSRKKSLVELHTKLGLATDDDTLRKYLYSFRLKSAKITVPKIAWLKLQGQASDLANHIRNMHWTVKHAQKANLPIPDSAMVHFRQLGRQTVIGINASVEPGSFFTIPISSNSLIEFGPAKELRTIQMQVSATDFSVQRRQLVGAAKRFVFVKRQCADIEKWARELPKIEVPNAAKVPNPNQPKLNFGWK